MFGLFRKKTKSDEPSASCIVPRIKHTNFLLALKEVGAGPEDMPVTEPFAADLLVTYAFDLPGMFQMFTHRDMKELGMTILQVRATAVANLKKQITEIQMQSQGPIHMPVTGNDLEACLLLLDEIWEAFSSKVQGEIVAAVPTRDILFFTGSESPEGVQVVREAIVEAQKAETTHTLTQHLLVRRNGGGWEVFAG
jgi:uncharacterized protein YtpQ (UPF0354 family)